MMGARGETQSVGGDRSERDKNSSEKMAGLVAWELVLKRPRV